MAQIKDKLYNRIIEGKLVLEDGDDVSAKVKSEIKVGYYAMNEDNTKYEFIGDEVPEDYTGHSIFIGDDGFIYLEQYNNGVALYSLEISSQALNLIKNGVVTNSFSLDGVSKLNFVQLTHSFNELDSTLKTMIESALRGQAQPCTLAQWNVVKALLDKSLYLSYETYIMIKIGSYTDEDIQRVYFSSAITGVSGGASLSLMYDASSGELSGTFE